MHMAERAYRALKRSRQNAKPRTKSYAMAGSVDRGPNIFTVLEDSDDEDGGIEEHKEASPDLDFALPSSDRNLVTPVQEPMNPFESSTSSIRQRTLFLDDASVIAKLKARVHSYEEEL